MDDHPALTPIERVRRTHRRSTDPRVSRTRSRIFAAVETLTARRQNPITVADIVREAGVSKTSFYSHFAGFDQLALAIVEHAYAELRAINEIRTHPELDTYATLRMTYERLVEHYVTYRSFYASVVSLRLSRSVHTDAVRAMVEDIEPWIATHSNLPPGIRPHLAASFIASSVVGFLDEWIEANFEATPEELLEHLMALLPAWYIGA